MDTSVAAQRAVEVLVAQQVQGDGEGEGVGLLDLYLPSEALCPVLTIETQRL